MHEGGEPLHKRARTLPAIDAAMPPSATTDDVGGPSKVDKGNGAAANSMPLAAAVQKLQTGVVGLEALLAEVMQAAQSERDQLQEEQLQLATEKKNFDQEKDRILQVLSDSEQVVLNVGGYRFTTTVSTLRGAPTPSLFSAMFSGRYDLARAEDGSVFIDRDGRHFADVLNFLRSQQLAYPPDGTDFKYLLELRAEAEFYGLTGLVALIDRYPYNTVRVVRCGTFNTDDMWMYEDGEDEVVFKVDAPCQLLGVGLCGTEATYLAELGVWEVEPEDFSGVVDRLAAAAQSFTKSDGPVVKLQLPDPVLLQPDKYYMLSVTVKGTESYCCEDCMETVIAGGVKVQFQCWESPNGTNEQRGQFPELYIRPMPQS